MSLRGRLSLLGTLALLATACSSAASPSAAAPSAAAPSAAAPSAAAPSVAPVAGGLLEKIMKAGTLVVSTEPKYPPQSELKPDGTFEGFDIDVATEIAKRLGVKVEFKTPDWSAITAGGWAGRWDISVGSMTITVERSKVLDFSPPYYYTPAQMTASVQSGITTLDGLAGKTICSAEATTYDAWLNGKLDYGTGEDLGKPPAGIKTITLPTDTDCPDQWKAGRFEFDGWLTSITTVDGAIKAGIPLVKVGAPVYYEPLAVAMDRRGPADTDFLPILKKIIGDMHADGTLSAMSMKWFKAEYTLAQ